MNTDINDKDIVASAIIKKAVKYWKVLLALGLALAFPPLIPVFIGIGIYLLIKDL